MIYLLHIDRDRIQEDVLSAWRTLRERYFDQEKNSIGKK